MDTEARTVPRRVMFYWGNDKMSWLRYMTLYSFRKFNPNWKIELYFSPPNKIRKKPWGDQNLQDFFAYGGEDYTDKLKALDIEFKEWDLFHPDDPKNTEWRDSIGPSHKSNFFKWSKLALEGGIYADLDILFVRPMDDFYEEIKEFDVSLAYCRNYFSIGVLGGMAGSQFYKDVWMNGFKTVTTKGYQTAGVINVYSLLNGGKLFHRPHRPPFNLWDRLARAYGKKEKLYNFGMRPFYSFGPRGIGQIFNNTQARTVLHERLIGIHWYAGHPIAQGWNRKLTEKNIGRVDSTIAHWCRYVLDY